MTRVPAPDPARSGAPAAPEVSRRAVAVFVAALLAYVVAVVHRTAMGVAGVEAVERFGVGATALSWFVVAQLAFYALMQIPAGRLLDRFGARAVITVGSLVMAGGQLLLASADSVPEALVARVLLGTGDAGIFISAVRLIDAWFPPRRAPVLVQLTGLIGQSGNLASAIGVAWVLHRQGWTTTFTLLAALGAVATCVAFLGIRSPEPREVRRPERFAPAVLAAVRPAGTRLGFWSHFATPFSANVVALLWGVPFFVTAQGRTPAEASALLTVLTLTAMVVGPVVGRFTARHPLRRSWSVLASCVVTLLAWVWLLVPSGPRPMWQLVVFVVLVGAGGPVSLVGMDFARTFAPPASLGTASGFVNTGGFSSTILGLLGVGVVLQLVEPDGAGTYSLDAYRLAFTVLLVPWVVGVVGVLVSRRRTRAAMREAGVVVPPVREVLRRRRG